MAIKSMPIEERRPTHVAMIMDGNGRWAKSRFLPRVEGHRQGAKTVRMVVEQCRRLGIRYLTLFAFSTENWNRPKAEVGALMKLLQHHLTSELDELHSNGIRVRVIGEVERLPENIGRSIGQAQELTANNDKMDLILAVSYGGRREIARAAQLLAIDVQRGVVDPESIGEDVFARYLYAPDVPDPDLLIRTSDELRISNFLLWQLAYTEIVVSDKCWPDFSKEEFARCLDEYSKRTRRYGLTSEQIAVKFTDVSSNACPDRAPEEGGDSSCGESDTCDLGEPIKRMA
jgi:undecaprenyl diphosphate synthase